MNVKSHAAVGEVSVANEADSSGFGSGYLPLGQVQGVDHGKEHRQPDPQRFSVRLCPSPRFSCHGNQQDYLIMQHPGEPLASPHFEQIFAPSLQQRSEPLIWPHFAQIFGEEVMVCPPVFSTGLDSQPTTATDKAVARNNARIRFMFVLLRIL